DQEVARKNLKDQWGWMKNYRVWEANRKVFLYPENYIRPELRDTKTPAFKTLEEDLMQGEITEDAVLQAYNKYLDEYTEVSRLTIAGGYVYDDPEETDGTKILALFGRTKTDPMRYYFRTAEFAADDAITWDPWYPVDVSINAEYVSPVYAFGRIFAFWTDIETTVEEAEDATVTSTEDDDTYTASSSDQTTYTVKIYFSFYNLNGEWMQAQALDTEISSTSEISNVELYVVNSETLTLSGTDNDYENIVINCAYSIGDTDYNSAYALTPELYTEAADKARVDNDSWSLVQTLFDEVGIENQDVVWINSDESSSEGAWFSLDYKGGSFLCKPDVDSLPDDAWPEEVEQSDNLPDWDKIGAAAHIPGGVSLFFDESGKYTDSANLTSKSDIVSRWGWEENNISSRSEVEAAWEKNGKIYLFSGTQYLTYSDHEDLADGPFHVKTSGDNNLPSIYEEIHAAFTDKDGIDYFFNNDRGTFVTSKQPKVEVPIGNYWGKKSDYGMPANITTTITSPAGKTYMLFDDGTHIRFNGTWTGGPEDGYPAAGVTADVILGDMGVSNASSLSNQTIASSVREDKIVYVFLKNANGNNSTIRKIDFSSDSANPTMTTVTDVSRKALVSFKRSNKVYRMVYGNNTNKTYTITNITDNETDNTVV
ncbi:MAG: neuraminidase-like domain-containing protein, partial [Bacteroidota bacterium]